MGDATVVSTPVVVPAWQKALDVDGKDSQVLGSGHHTLFTCQEPGVPFRWAQIVMSQGNIYAAKVLAIVIPKTLAIYPGDSLLDILRAAGPENCKVVLIHEKRPYPALVKDYPGTTLRELAGGVIDDGDVTLAKGGVREFLQELGANPEAIVAQKPLLRVPAPASAGAQIEGYYLHCILYRGATDFKVSSDEPIAKFELVPLPEAHHSLLARHEDLQECTEIKTLLALQMLQQEYIDKFGKTFFHREGS